MNYSNNYELNLPSRDGDDLADVNLLSENFEIIDGVMANNNRLIRANRELIMKSVRLGKIVEALPTENILEHTIYFMPKTDPQENNRYDKFVYLNIGTTEAPEYVWEKL